MLRRGGRLARCGDCTQCRSPSCMHPTRGHSNFELKRLARVVMGILVLAVSTVSTVSAVSAAAAAFQRHAAGSAAAHPTPAAPVAVVALCVATRRASGHTPPCARCTGGRRGGATSWSKCARGGAAGGSKWRPVQPSQMDRLA